MTEIKKDILWRVYLMYFSILLFGLAIIVKIFFIQFKEGPKLRTLAQTQELRAFNLKASRGNILAADGSLLATSVPVFEIRMDVASPNISDKYFMDNVDELATGLSKTLNNMPKSHLVFYSECGVTHHTDLAQKFSPSLE